MSEAELPEGEESPVPVISNWEFLGVAPTRQQVVDLLGTLAPVYGVATVDFADFVQPLPQKKKVKRPHPENPNLLVDEYLESFTLYMSVAGRIKMLNAAQEENDWRVDFRPEPKTPTGIPGYLSVDPRLVYREYVSIADGVHKLGSRAGTAWVPYSGGGGAAGSNPFEKCLVPGTRVLTADLRWAAVETLVPGQELVGFDENPSSRGIGQRFRRSVVEDVAMTDRPTVMVRTDRREVVCSRDHGWLLTVPRTWRQWRSAEELVGGDRIVSIGDPWSADDSRAGGWLAGFLDGEGHVGNGLVRFTQKSGLVLDEAVKLFDELGVDYGLNVEQRLDGSEIVRGHVRGGLGGSLRALGMIRPVRLMTRSAEVWEGRRSFGRALRHEAVQEVVDGGVRPVVAVKTSTRTFIAEGLFSHNCETSARGRGLGAWGFGVLPGSGVASLEEMQAIAGNRAAMESEPVGRGQRKRKSKPELLSETLELMEQVRLARGQEPSEIKMKVADYLADSLGVAGAYDPGEDKLDLGRLREGQLTILGNQFRDTLAKIAGRESPV